MSLQGETLTDTFGLCIVGFASASHDSCKGARLGTIDARAVSTMQGSSKRSVGDDDLGPGVVRKRRAAGEDEVGVLPGPMSGDERHFLEKPALVRDAGIVATINFRLVGLHPESSVKKVGELFTGRANALEHQKLDTMRHDDRTSATALDQRWRTE